MLQKLYVFCSINGENIESFFKKTLKCEYDTFYDKSILEKYKFFIDNKDSDFEVEKLWFGSNGILYLLLSYRNSQRKNDLVSEYAKHEFNEFLVCHDDEKRATINWVYPIYLNVDCQENTEVMKIAWGTVSFNWSVMHIENSQKNPAEDKEFFESIFNTFSNYDLILMVNSIVSKYLIEITKLNSYKYIDNVIRIVNIYLYSIDLKSKLVNYEYQSFENTLIKMCSIDNYYSTLNGYNEILISNIKNSNLQKDEAFKNKITIIGIVVSMLSFLKIDALFDVFIKYFASNQMLSFWQWLINTPYAYILILVTTLSFYIFQRYRYRDIENYNMQLVFLMKRKNEIR